MRQFSAEHETGIIMQSNRNQRCIQPFSHTSHGHYTCYLNLISPASVFIVFTGCKNELDISLMYQRQINVCVSVVSLQSKTGITLQLFFDKNANSRFIFHFHKS